MCKIVKFTERKRNNSGIIFLTTMKFKYLQLVLQSNRNENSTEYYKNTVTATTYVNY